MSFDFQFRKGVRRAPRSFTSTTQIVLLTVLIIVSTGLSHAATLDDSARELAGAIVGGLHGNGPVRVQIRSLSSLAADQIAQIEQVLRAELQARGTDLAGDASSPVVNVTLSENVRGMVWTAEIRGGTTGAGTTIVITVPATLDGGASANAKRMVLRAEKLWEGPTRILDAQRMTDSNGKVWLVLLAPDGLQIQDRETGATSTVAIASDQASKRDPEGSLAQVENGAFAVVLQPNTCTVTLETWVIRECHPNAKGLPPEVSPNSSPPADKGDFVEFQACARGHWLATGANDYTQLDSLQAFDGATPISNELQFPGPVTAIHATSAEARAVVHNVKTGNYEAYSISVASCGS